jgi:TolA-binding protein
MTCIALLLALASAQSPAAEISVREIEGQMQVDARGDAVEPLAFARSLATGSGRALEGGELLADRGTLELNLAGRSLEDVLALLAHATRTRVDVDRHAIVFSSEFALTDAEDIQADAEAAWVSLVREFPDHEAARTARVWLGIAQERRGHEDAALTHYDAAARDEVDSPAAERALRAASDLLMRRGRWDAAMQRLSRLARTSPQRNVQIDARLGVARALAEQGRGTEALALVDVVDLSYPPSGEAEVAARRLVRARGHLAAGAPASALRELDARAVLDPRLGESLDDLELRARSLEQLDSPLEAARAWLACAGSRVPADRGDALASAARLSASAGDDLAVLFIERVAQGGSAEAAVTRLADSARVRLGLADHERSVEHLEKSWADRAQLTGRDRAALASDLVSATARERGAEEAAVVARKALETVSATDGRSIRTALAIAYENEGAWAEAARVWGGTAP